MKWPRKKKKTINVAVVKIETGYHPDTNEARTLHHSDFIWWVLSFFIISRKEWSWNSDEQVVRKVANTRMCYTYVTLATGPVISYGPKNKSN
jgi:hypothetical protein